MRFTPRLKDLVFMILLMFMSTLYYDWILTKGRLGCHAFIESMRYSVCGADTESRRFERMQPYLLEIGITEDAKVVFMPDPSFNITLFYSDRRGWTNFKNIGTAEVTRMISKGASYLFVLNDNTLKEEFLQPYLINLRQFKSLSYRAPMRPQPVFMKCN